MFENGGISRPAIGGGCRGVVGFIPAWRPVSYPQLESGFQRNGIAEHDWNPRYLYFQHLFGTIVVELITGVLSPPQPVSLSESLLASICWVQNISESVWHVRLRLHELMGKRQAWRRGYSPRNSTILSIWYILHVWWIAFLLDVSKISYISISIDTTSLSEDYASKFVI